VADYTVAIRHADGSRSARRWNGCRRLDATPSRHRGHSASGHDGTESESSERAGTANASPGAPRSTIEPTATNAPSGRVDRPRPASRVDLPVVKTSLDDDDRLAGLDREAASQREGAVLALDEHRAARSRARAVSCPMKTPAERRRHDRARRRTRGARRRARARPARRAAGHIRSRAHWQIAIGVSQEERRKWPVRRAPVSSKSFKGDHAGKSNSTTSSGCLRLLSRSCGARSSCKVRRGVWMTSAVRLMFQPFSRAWRPEIRAPAYSLNSDSVSSSRPRSRSRPAPRGLGRKVPIRRSGPRRS
jgi:hypothetical protein